MITVKLYGLLRIESGIRQRSIEAAGIEEVFLDLQAQGISPKALRSCVILVNGKPTKKHCPLHDGDILQFLPPVAGG